MAPPTDQLLLGFAAFQLADAVACAIPVPYIKRELDRIGCPQRLQRALPAIKVASAAGLLAGRRDRRAAVVTAAALTAYFACAVGFHVKAHDALAATAPAAGLGIASALLLRRASA